MSDTTVVPDPTNEGKTFKVFNISGVTQYTRFGPLLADADKYLVATWDDVKILFSHVDQSAFKLVEIPNDSILAPEPTISAPVVTPLVVEETAPVNSVPDTAEPPPVITASTEKETQAPTDIKTDAENANTESTTQKVIDSVKQELNTVENFVEKLIESKEPNSKE